MESISIIQPPFAYPSATHRSSHAAVRTSQADEPEILCRCEETHVHHQLRAIRTICFSVVPPAVPPPPLPAQSFSNLLTTKVPSELVAKVAFVPLSINHPIHPGLRLNQKKSLPACTPTVYLIVGIPHITEPVAIIL